MGSWAAARVAARGASCALIDQFDPGHDKGSSHGDGRIFRFAYVEDEYVDMMGFSLPLWEDLQAHAGEELMAKTGGVCIDYASARSSGRSSDLGRLEEMYRKRGAPYEFLCSDALKERYPQYHLPKDMEALFQKDLGVLFATKCVRATWRFAETLGAELRPRTEVVQLQKDGDGVVAITSNGEDISAKRVILAPGPWLSGAAESLFGLKIPTKVSAETVSYFAPKSGCEVDHSFRSMPVFLSFMGNGLTEFGYYGLPAIEIPGVKLSAHYAGPIVDPRQRPTTAGGSGASSEEEEAARQRIDEVLAANRRIVASQFPYLEPEPFLSQNCLYTSTPDHDYIIDRVPGFESVVLAGGGSGHAFKMGPAIGELSACLALGEEPRMSFVEKFSLQRPSLQRTGATADRK